MERQLPTAVRVTRGDAGHAAELYVPHARPSGQNPYRAASVSSGLGPGLATSSTSSADPVVLYSGWLNKQGGVFLGYKRRFFELKRNGRLVYSKKEGSGEPAGEIRLHGATVSKNFATDPTGVLELTPIPDVRTVLDFDVKRKDFPRLSPAPIDPQTTVHKMTVSSPLQSRIFYLKGPEADLDRWEGVLKEAIRRLPALFEAREKAPQRTQSLVVPRNRVSSGSAQNQFVFKAGWLHKRGRFNTAFKRRWFVLKKARLEYYKCHTEMDTPRGVILVAEGSSRIIPSAQGDFARHLEVSSVEGRVYVLATRSDRELGDWLHAIRARHGDKRLGQFHAVPTSERPATIAIDDPPQPSQSDFGGSASNTKMVLRSLTKIAPLETICKVGCGGPECKHCDPCRGRSEPIPSAIGGLNASWVTHNCIACSRPSKRLIEMYDIRAQFKDKGITCVYNLQTAGEHADCGDGNIDGRWAYDPQMLVESGVSVRCYGWTDFGCPTHENMLRMVRDMASETTGGGRVLVHCHAGHGRTGLLIACWLVFACGYTPAEAITLVRLRRAKAIQTSAQAAMIKGFAVYLRNLRTIFDRGEPERPRRQAVAELVVNRVIVPSTESTRLGNRHAFLDFVGRRLVRLLERKGASLAAVPNTTSVVGELKRQIDNGNWAEIEKCVDAAALSALTLAWISLLEAPVLRDTLIDAIKVAAKERDPASLITTTWSTLAEQVEHEIVRCLLTMMQHMHRRTAVAVDGGSRTSSYVDKFAIAVAETVMMESTAEFVGGDIIELADALSVLAAMEDCPDFVSFSQVLHDTDVHSTTPAASASPDPEREPAFSQARISRSQSWAPSSLPASFTSEKVEIARSTSHWGDWDETNTENIEMDLVGTPDSPELSPPAIRTSSVPDPPISTPEIDQASPPSPRPAGIRRFASESIL